MSHVSFFFAEEIFESPVALKNARHSSSCVLALLLAAAVVVCGKFSHVSQSDSSLRLYVNFSLSNSIFKIKDTTKYTRFIAESLDRKVLFSSHRP